MWDLIQDIAFEERERLTAIAITEVEDEAIPPTAGPTTTIKRPQKKFIPKISNSATIPLAEKITKQANHGPATESLDTPTSSSAVSLLNHQLREEKDVQLNVTAGKPKKKACI